MLSQSIRTREARVCPKTTSRGRSNRWRLSFWGWMMGGEEETKRKNERERERERETLLINALSL